MKGSRAILTVTWFALFLFIIGYVVYNLSQVFSTPPRVVGAVMFTAEEIIPANVWFIRDEITVPAASAGITQTVPEGTRVSKGDPVARVYDNAASLADSLEISDLKLRLHDMEQAEMLAAGASDAVTETSELFRIMAKMMSARDRRLTEDYSALSADFKSGVFRWEYSYGGEMNLDAEIFRVKTRIAEIETARAGAVSSVAAPISGMFSPAVDGYEGVLTKAALQTMTAADLQAIEPDLSAAPQSLGRMVSGHEWYAAAVVDAKTRNSFYVGRRLKIRFAGADAYEVTFRVDRIAEPEGGSLLIIFSATTAMSDFVSLRNLPADIITNSLTGLRVPKEAVHINPKTLERGVYCLTNKSLKFRPITVIADRETYYLAAYNPSAVLPRNLIPGDSMVVNGKNLYDDKVVIK